VLLKLPPIANSIQKIQKRKKPFRKKNRIEQHEVRLTSEIWKKWKLVKVNECIKKLYCKIFHAKAPLPWSSDFNEMNGYVTTGTLSHHYYGIKRLGISIKMKGNIHSRILVAADKFSMQNFAFLISKKTPPKPINTYQQQSEFQLYDQFEALWLYWQIMLL